MHSDNLRLTRDEWLDKVAVRDTPAKLEHPYRYKIFDIELAGTEAVAKVSEPLLGTNYIDFLCCLKEDGEWKIVIKLQAKIES